jgi:two-component system response regulator QseB
MKVLLVEDDSMFGETLRQGLISGGHTVDWLRSGSGVEAVLLAQTFDIVLLDLGLPGRDGLTILRQMRSSKQTVPVIILTARSDVANRIVGLDLGADDYLSKPFALAELEARIRALTRRAAGNTDTIMSYGELQLNPITKEVLFRNSPVALSISEYRLLTALLQRPGAILSKEQLVDKLYDWNTEIDSNTIEVHIHRLRQKLSSELIRTVRGLGYQLVSQ